ncbi:hypothetical protein D3C80_2097100 [compost metagenome]
MLRDRELDGLYGFLDNMSEIVSSNRSWIARNRDGMCWAIDVNESVKKLERPAQNI